MPNEGEASGSFTLKTKHVRIVGTGLIGTSIALGLAQHGLTVELFDDDAGALALAQDLLKNQISEAPVDLVIIATPPSNTLNVLRAELSRNPQAMFIDVGSVKFKLQQEIDRLSDLRVRFLGTHPMAGREVSGPSSAQADLFAGRAWIITPTKFTSEELTQEIKSLIELLGATVYEMTPETHDETMARISHLPQLISSSVASLLNQQEFGTELAGQGLRDMTRIAASDPKLWEQIFIENRNAITQALNDFEQRLEEFKNALNTGSSEAITKLIDQGRLGRSKLSGKHGAKPRNYAHLLVVIKDEPGALSSLFNECASISANIEDLAIEHSPGQYTGLITLAFSPEDAQRVFVHLSEKNWNAHLR